ncbi:hypothetical protein E2C01_007261 [Portunus trituberculatus]|uniref:Uncharacterized protein n=1 Tax=Portunus trituberculatus TaxID=210409 RepID=A0A5B7D0G5_PORTR|nr:hypothetical protein [Portunus trituberculatus]
MLLIRRVTGGWPISFAIWCSTHFIPRSGAAAGSILESLRGGDESSAVRCVGQSSALVPPEHTAGCRDSLPSPPLRRTFKQFTTMPDQVLHVEPCSHPNQDWQPKVLLDEHQSYQQQQQHQQDGQYHQT